MVSEYAQRLYPTLRRDQAFSKLFSADTEEAATIRKAHAVVKNSPMMKSYPIAFGDSPAVAGDNAAVVGDDSSALAELTRRAEKSKRPGEELCSGVRQNLFRPEQQRSGRSRARREQAVSGLTRSSAPRFATAVRDDCPGGSTNQRRGSTARLPVVSMLPGAALDCRGGGRVPRTRLRRAVPCQAKQLRPPVEGFLASRPATNNGRDERRLSAFGAKMDAAQVARRCRFLTERTCRHCESKLLAVD